MRIQSIFCTGAIALLGLGGTHQAYAADPRIGTWTLLSAQSTLTPPDKLSIVASRDKVHVVMTGKMSLDFSVRSDGHDGPVPGNPGFNQVHLRKMGKRQVELTEKKDGAVVATLVDKVSKDGNELTMTTMSHGQPDQITVWGRTGGAKNAENPFAGEWVADPSKTRQQQGVKLTIQPDGNDGVRFAGNYSYTARFDGKQYGLTNSDNDTVQLQMADAHTVNATYRRDDQVSQQDKWVVSADGKQMTLTTTGTLQSGQHLAEKLTFQKQ